MELSYFRFCEADKHFSFSSKTKFISLRYVHTKDDQLVQLGWSALVECLLTSTLVQLFAFSSTWNQLKFRKNQQAKWRRTMQLSPNYSPPFDKTDIKSIVGEWLIEADQRRTASIRLIIFTSTLYSAQADHPCAGFGPN